MQAKVLGIQRNGKNIQQDEFYENKIKLDDWIEFSFKNIGRHD